MTAPETAADIYAVHRCPGAPGPLSPHNFALTSLTLVLLLFLFYGRGKQRSRAPTL